jgi:hypothetical protein
MPQKILPTSGQKKIFVLHVLVFAIINALMWLTYDLGADSWVYPWPAWITAAWGLSLVGHWCTLYTTYEDKGMDDYSRQLKN